MEEEKGKVEDMKNISKKHRFILAPNYLLQQEPVITNGKYEFLPCYFSSREDGQEMTALL